MKDGRYIFGKIVLIATSIALLVLILLGAVTKKDQELFVSEACSHNVTVKYDPVGYYSDYLVVTNCSDHTINLENYRLSDDDRNPRKFLFPSMDLPSGESVTAWCADPSEFEPASVDETYGEFFTDQMLYTGFGISDKEAIYLSDPKGIVVDSFILPLMTEDQVFIRSKASDEGVVSEGKSGDAAGIVDKGIKAPRMSEDSGFYEEGFSLEISSDGGDIYYTLNGEDPYDHGIKYTAPIEVSEREGEENLYASRSDISILEDFIEDKEVYVPEIPVDKATVVRAITRSGDGRCSEETVSVFFVGDEIMEKYRGTDICSIVADPDDLFSDEKGIYVTGNVWSENMERAGQIEDPNPFVMPTNYNSRGRGWHRDARFLLFDEDGNLKYNEDGEISIHGGYSRSINQKSFSLWPADMGKKVFDGLLGDAGSNLILRTGGADERHLTNIRDVLNNRISKDLKVGAQPSVCCQVFLNGEYWGCYNLQERLDESYVAARYRVPEEQVNLIKNFAPVSGSEEDLRQYQDLETFVNKHDLSKEAYYREFCDRVDIESLIDYYCAEVYFANADAYYNNVALWRSRSVGPSPYEDGKWRYILFDTDGSSGYDDWKADVDSFTAGNWSVRLIDEEPFFSSLIQNAEFRKQFRDRFLYLAEHDFSYETVGGILDEMEGAYTKPMVLSLQRFESPDYTEEQYGKNVKQIRSFFSKRGEYICNYLMEHLGE